MCGCVRVRLGATCLCAEHSQREHPGIRVQPQFDYRGDRDEQYCHLDELRLCAPYGDSRRQLVGVGGPRHGGDIHTHVFGGRNLRLSLQHPPLHDWDGDCEGQRPGHHVYHRLDHLNRLICHHLDQSCHDLVQLFHFGVFRPVNHKLPDFSKQDHRWVIHLLELRRGDSRIPVSRSDSSRGRLGSCGFLFRSQAIPEGTNACSATAALGLRRVGTSPVWTRASRRRSAQTALAAIPRIRASGV